MRVLKDCFGTWRPVPADMVVTCPECRGAAELVISHPSGDPQCERVEPCYRCGGEGEVPEEIDDDGEVSSCVEP